MKQLNVGIIGYKFMGKAHSNAWRKAPYFFDLNIEPVLKVACGRHEGSLKEFADRWGWEEIETDWTSLILVSPRNCIMTLPLKPPKQASICFVKNQWPYLMIKPRKCTRSPRPTA